MAGGGMKGMPGGKGGAPAPETYVCTTRGNDGNEVVIRTLVGEYTEHGSNHGRKVYKRGPDASGEPVDVYLYFWDKRDGPNLEGWWFGNQLGGSQVWSHCSSSDMTPPSTGWRIPWDGGVRPTLILARKAAPQAQGPPQQSPQELAQLEERFKEVSLASAEAQSTAKSALDQAQAAAGDYTNREGLKTAEELVAPQVSAINELGIRLTRAQQGAQGDALRQFSALGNSLRAAHQALTGELNKIRQAKAQADQSEKQKAAEEKESVALQDVLLEGTQKTNAAEDAVEKAVITNEMIAAGGEDIEEVKRAVTQTEQAAQEAQKAIGEARIYLNAKQASARRFESDKVKQEATGELGKLQQQLQEAQNKLNPLKSVRQDFHQRAAVQKLVAEVLEMLSPAEVDVDRAEEATTMLSTAETPTKEGMTLAEEAVAKANDHMASVAKFIEPKKKTAHGLALTELEKMEERVRSAQQRLQGLKGKQKEALERLTCEALLKEAQEKLQAVAESVNRVAEAEGPFLMGVEELPLEETLTAVKACEAAAMAANTAASVARMFIATKIVEAKRFSAAASKEAQEKLKGFQTELDRHLQKLMDLKKSTASRKKAATMREAEAEVQKAEDLSKKVSEAAAAFEDDAKLLQLASKEIRAASDETIKAEQAANTALAEARKFITQRQIESKGKEMSAEVSAELIKYQTRLSTAQAEVGKYKKLSATVEQRLQAKKTIEDAQTKLKAAEEKVAKVCAMVDALGTEAPEAPKTEEAEDGEAKEGEAKEGETKKDGEESAMSGPKAAEHAAAEAQVALKTIARFVETQTRVQGVAKDEIVKLQPLVKQAQDMLDSTVATMKERTEKILVETLLKESEARVKEAEDAVGKVSEAEVAFQKPPEEQTVDEASAALSNLEAALQASHAAVGGAKTFLAMKRLAAKRLSEKSSKITTDQLSEMQTRLDAVTKQLGEAKKCMADRKLATVKREVSEKVVQVEKQLETATEATKALVDGGVDLDAEEMKAACEKAGSTQQEAQNAVTATKTLLLNRQRDTKGTTTDPSIPGEITKMLEKLTKIQADLDKQKSLLREQEHKFVASRLLKDGTELVEELEKKLESTTEVAAPLASDKEDFTAGVFLSQAVEALKAHMKKEAKTPKEIVEAMSENGAVAKGKFVPYCLGLAELKEENGNVLSEENLEAAFGRLDAKGSGEVKQEDFLDHLRIRFVCAAVVSMTELLSVKSGKTIRKLDKQEVVEALEEPSKDESVGLMRVKCRAEKDDKEGYITVSGNQGTVYLEPYSPNAALQKKIEKSLNELAEAAKEAAKYLEQKTEELKAVRVGPLADTKAELAKIRPRVSKVQYAHSQMKKRVADFDQRMKARMDTERKKRQEVAERKAATAMIADVDTLMTASFTAVDAALPVAEKLIADKGADLENPLQAMDDGQKGLDAAMAAIEKAQAKIKEHMDEIKTSQTGPYSEARSSLVKLKVKLGAQDARCKKQTASLRAARKQVAGEAGQAVVAALRTHVQKEGIKADELFTKLSGGKPEVTGKKLREFVEKIPGHGLKAVQLDVGFDAYVAGVPRLVFSELLQEFHRCVKDISLTTSFQVKDSKPVRKLLAGEVVEVVEAAKIDEATGLPRVKCRALKDEKEGWVTLRGNQGTNFLDKCAKPYFCCEEEVLVSAAFESSSKEIFRAQVGEVLEVLLGPEKEPPVESQRLKGRAGKDGKAGWVSLKDAQGNLNLEVEKLLVCRTSIVITTAFDITEGKALRRLEVGETLQILEGPTEDSIRSLTRIKAKAKNDGKEGWVTMKGNQGTAYVEETSRHYVCQRPVALESRFQTGTPLVRHLEEGEVFEAVEEPSTEKREGPKRMKGRNIATGTVGWFTLGAKNVQPWSPQYRCAQSTTMTDGLDIKEAKTVRKLEAGELLTALEPPVLETGSGIMRVRARAEKDGKVGYASVRGNQGTSLLKPILS